MKKFLTMGALALAVAVFSQDRASAWVNFKAGIGANLGYQSGGNCLLWGAFRNGQPPAPVGGGFGGGCPMPAPAPMPAPLPQGHGFGHRHAAPTDVPPPFVAPGQVQSRTIPAYQTGYRYQY